MCPWTTKFMVLSLSIGIITASLLQSPPPVLASQSALPCSNSTGQYYTPLIPFFNTHTRQITLVDPKTYHVVQVMADKVDNADAMYYSSSWSNSCRYFAFSVVVGGKTDTDVWDTQAQRIAGLYENSVPYDPAYVTWSPDDRHLILDNNQGEYLWNLAVNQMFRMDRYPSYSYTSSVYQWDFQRNQALKFDGFRISLVDLSTGNFIREFLSPFQGSLTSFEFSADGKTIRLWDPFFDMWSITYDRNNGAILDVHALGSLPADQVQFSPDRRFIVVGGETFDVFDTQNTDTGTRAFYGWSPAVAYFAGGHYTWHFVNATTLELDFTRTGEKQLIDLATGNVH